MTPDGLPPRAYTALHGSQSDEAVNEADPSATELIRLRTALSIAEQAARDAEFDAGRLRGELAEMRVQLGRARQEHEWATVGRPPVRTRAVAWSRRTLRITSSRAVRAVDRLRSTASR